MEPPCPVDGRRDYEHLTDGALLCVGCGYALTFDAAGQPVLTPTNRTHPRSAFDPPQRLRRVMTPSAMKMELLSGPKRPDSDDGSDGA